MERRTPEVSPDPPLSTSFRSSSSSSSLFSSFRTDSFDFGGYPPQSELEEVPSFRWLPDGLRPSTAQSNKTGGDSWSWNSSAESLPTPRTEDEILSSSNLKVFTFDELKGATRNFKPDCILGEGRFGCVYKGWIDEHTLSATRPGLGMTVAIKRLNLDGLQGDDQWLTNVQYLGQLHHPNLVKLIGYCLEGDHRLLVCEFMPRGSLEKHLFRRGGGQPLSWETRIQVAVRAARGLSFLRDLKSQVIHPNVKTSNILLDVEFNAKLSDFGFENACSTNDLTHATILDVLDGLVVPEYGPVASRTHASFIHSLAGLDGAPMSISTQIGVFNFGIVLLELLSGRQALNSTKVGMERNFVDWVMPYLGDQHMLLWIMDPRLGGQFPEKGASIVAKLASQCLSNKTRMSNVLATLEQVQEDSRTWLSLRK